MKSHKAQIGQRLAELRKTLSADSGVELSQVKLAQEAGLSQEIISRLENGMGSTENLLTILLFYDQKGYNMRWVLIPDNQDISLYHQESGDSDANPEIRKALEKLNSLLLKKRK
jgi:transcriptional regulator with XRE-family HTH domain